jgi:hypothetical protein
MAEWPEVEDSEGGPLLKGFGILVLGSEYPRLGWLRSFFCSLVAIRLVLTQPAMGCPNEQSLNGRLPCIPYSHLAFRPQYLVLADCAIAFYVGRMDAC